MMAPFNGKLVTVFGGSGFVGRYVVRLLAKRGWRVRVAVRRPDLAGHLQPDGAPGQVQPIQANLRYPDSVARAIAGADAVVNLVGILYESGKQGFDAVQAEGAATVARAAAAAGVGQFVQISAIGADAGSESDYARSKAAGEAAVLAAMPGAVIIRPSIVFGQEDDFFNRFGEMARLSPVLPLIGGGASRFQPVYVGDVATAIVSAVEGQARPGTVYELGGPDVKSFRACMELVNEITQRNRFLVSIPVGIAKLQATFLQMLPKPMLTVDQVKLLGVDNVVSEAAKAEGRTLEGLGVAPHTLAAILPTYMWRFRPHGQFDRKLA